MYSKRDTNEVLDWLRSNAIKKEKHYAFDLRLTLKDIHYAANLVIARKVEIPKHIQTPSNDYCEVDASLPIGSAKLRQSKERLSLPLRTPTKLSTALSRKSTT